MPKSELLYDRAPSDDLLTLFKPGQLLSPLTNKDLRVRSLDVCVDVHFRPGDWVHVYCGLTRVLDLKRLESGKLKLTAHQTYRNQPCGEGFFSKEWEPDDSAFTRALDNYLGRVEVNVQHVKSEGSVQLKWSRVNPNLWIPFDRELRLANRDGNSCKELKDAYSELKKIYRQNCKNGGRDRWRKPKKMTALKLDQLAVDPEGSLVLVELKSSKTTDYYASFQLLQYLWEWHSALQSSPALLRQVRRLLDARLEVGMSPKPTVPLTGGIRGVVGLGCDGRSKRVKCRHDIVLDIVNGHLPPGVCSVQTWKFGDSPQEVGRQTN